MLERLLRQYEYALDSIQRSAIIKVACRYLCPKDYKKFIKLTKQLAR